MNPAALVADKLRERLREEMGHVRMQIRLFRSGSDFSDMDSLQSEILIRRHDRYIANQLERWLHAAERATSIDDLLVTLGTSHESWTPSHRLPAADLPPLEADSLAAAKKMLAEGSADLDDNPLTWSELTGTQELAPPGWIEPPPGGSAPASAPPGLPEPARGRARAGSGRPADGAADGVDPNDTAPGIPGQPPDRASSPDPAGQAPGTVRDRAPRPPADRSDGTIRERRPPGTPPSGPPEAASSWPPIPPPETALPSAKTLLTVTAAAAAARRGITALRLLQLAGGGLVIAVLVFGVWRLWGSAGADPEASATPIIESGSGATGQLESVNVQGTFMEAASTYVTTPFQTSVSVIAVRHPLRSSIEVKVKGDTRFEVEFVCGEGEAVVESRMIVVNLGYEEVIFNSNEGGTFDPVSGAFSGPGTWRVVRDFNMPVDPFTDSTCTYLNNHQYWLILSDEFFGDGTVSGSASLDSGAVTVQTNWEWGDGIKVEGTFTGQGTVERY